MLREQRIIDNLGKSITLLLINVIILINVIMWCYTYSY
jgi:hypothetical protein